MSAIDPTLSQAIGGLRGRIMAAREALENASASCAAAEMLSGWDAAVSQVACAAALDAVREAAASAADLAKGASGVARGVASDIRGPLGLNDTGDWK